MILENPKLESLFKVWSHIGVTHDKTNEILASKGIPPIAVNIRVQSYIYNFFYKFSKLILQNTLIFLCIVYQSGEQSFKEKSK